MDRSQEIIRVMDAVNNLSDALSSVITIVGTKLSQRPADRKHPFGFGRIEYFSAIIIAVIVLSAGITSLIESVKKIFDPTEPSYTTTTLVVIVVAIIVKLILGQYVKRKGEQLKSDALIASGSDALFDTLATLISAGVMLLWGVSLDGILGALISIVIIKAGIEMLASPVNELLGTSISAELTKQIIKEVSAFEGVHGVFDLILHNYGPDIKIGSLHINVYDTMSAHEIHGLTRKITSMPLLLATTAMLNCKHRSCRPSPLAKISFRFTASTIQRKRICFQSMSSPIFPFTMMLPLPVNSLMKFSPWCPTCR